ncbi:MAG TPA: penicillin-insensitive murein endopeptidase [Kofleriaceae bacterium]|nr:penicillin-insensitive murein endopeptidase [Kofleriaceae bacterium]
MRLVIPTVIALAALSGGCVEWGVVSDGTSVSWGKANGGQLLGGRRLPLEGDGFHVLPTWSSRGTQWGTEELLDVIAYVGRSVAIRHPGTTLAVGDLSIFGGGASAHHRSHQTGRDVDLLLFATDLDGRPVPSTEMQRFGPDGLTRGKGPRRRFDAARTWSVVRALLEAPGPGVANIFVYAPLRDLLLDHARDLGEPEGLIDYAATVLAQPGDSAPHDDHLHVRIYCPTTDPGCVDYASRPPAKKPPAPSAALTELAGKMRAHPVVGAFSLRGGRW